MEPAREDVRFLARSTNRSAVLGALAGGPVTRDELVAALDASRVTIRRILSELEDRGWVERGSDGFETTAAGAVVAEEFEALVDAIRATRHLEGVLEWLPRDALDFDVGRLADARVTHPDAVTIAPVARVDELIREASEAAVLSAGISASTVATNRDAVVEAGQRFEGVVSTDALAAIRETPEVAADIREMIATERATMHATTAAVPEMMLAILDGVVVFGLLGGGLPRGVIESEDEVVRQWARALFQEYREGADELTVADLPD